MQFTGLIDKHGKEIYEGDIVKRFYNDQGVQIVFNTKTGCGFEFSVLTSYIFCKEFSQNYYEVIGNIYENPELLEK